MLYTLLILLASVIPFPISCEESGGQYLKNAVRGLRQLNGRQPFRKVTINMPSTTQRIDRRSHPDEDAPPPLTLTKGELAALYESAVAKGESIKLDTSDDSYINAAVHHLDDDYNAESQQIHTGYGHDGAHPTKPDDSDGYYYYYYPIKSFLDQLTSQPTEHSSPSYHHIKPKVTTHGPPYQYHSHSHQHNITITKSDVEKKEPKHMEPLFMAISGFIGMAVMFVLSVLVLPRFGKNKNPPKKNERINDIARLALQAIDHDCAERFACELTKTARTFNISENRFIKLLKRIVPGTFGRHINTAGKYANKQLKCTAIPCRKKPNNNNSNNNNNNQKKKKPPPHKNKH